MTHKEQADSQPLQVTPVLTKHEFQMFLQELATHFQSIERRLHQVESRLDRLDLRLDFTHSQAVRSSPPVTKRSVLGLLVLLLLIGGVLLVLVFSPPLSFHPPPLGEGTLTYTHWHYSDLDSTFLGHPVTSVLNVSLTEEVVLTALTSSTLQVEKTYTATVLTAYQRRYNTTAEPVVFHLDFYRSASDFEPVHSTTSLTFTLITTVDQSTGDCLTVINPYNATLAAITAAYQSADLPPSHSYQLFLPTVGTSTNLFVVNASHWQLEDQIEAYSMWQRRYTENFTVIGTGTLLNTSYSTWTLQQAKISPYATDYFHFRIYEQSTGLFVTSHYKFLSPVDHLEGHVNLVTLNGVIESTGLLIPGFGFDSLLFLLVIASGGMLRRGKKRLEGLTLNDRRHQPSSCLADANGCASSRVSMEV